MVNEGDLIASVAGVATIPSAVPWNASLLQTQKDFRANFCGISNTSRRVNDPSTNGFLTIVPFAIVVLDCATLGGALHVGQKIGPDKDTGNNLLDQTGVAVSDPLAAIGVLIEEAAVGATELIVLLKPFLVDGAFGV
jgi:hypothetical protein